MIKEIKKLIEQENKKGGSFAAVSVIESILEAMLMTDKVIGDIGIQKNVFMLDILKKEKKSFNSLIDKTMSILKSELED